MPTVVLGCEHSCRHVGHTRCGVGGASPDNDGHVHDRKIMAGNEQHPKSGRQLRLFHGLWRKVNVRAWTRRLQAE